jgi:phosphatidylserine/phosphatidylglycerophosphate/cardiolipin synthase-like enzyme
VRSFEEISSKVGRLVLCGLVVSGCEAQPGMDAESPASSGTTREPDAAAAPGRDTSVRGGDVPAPATDAPAPRTDTPVPSTDAAAPPHDGAPHADAPRPPDAAHSPDASAMVSSGFELEPVFTNLRISPRDPQLLDHIIRLIDDTPAGEEIRAGIHSITANIVVRAFDRARRRGVKIQVVHSGNDMDSTDTSPADLAAMLGDGHRWCGHGGTAHGCISTDPSGIMHGKLFLFSKTKNSAGVLKRWVSWFGSANMTWATGSESYNNTVTAYEDEALYAGFTRYFADLWTRKAYAGNDFYDPAAGRGEFRSPGGLTVYASPEQQTDFWVDRLNDVIPDASCQIRLAHAMIHESRRVVITKLIELKKAGCTVLVVAGGGAFDGTRVPAALAEAGIPVRHNKVHDKLILIHARYAGSTAPKKVVLTGSHNLTRSALRENDELLVRIDNDRLHDAFLAHFTRAYDSGS